MLNSAFSSLKKYYFTLTNTLCEKPRITPRSPAIKKKILYLHKNVIVYAELRILFVKKNAKLPSVQRQYLKNRLSLAFIIITQEGL